jgi:hypothetical protein
VRDSQSEYRRSAIIRGSILTASSIVSTMAALIHPRGTGKGSLGARAKRSLYNSDH